MKKIISVFICIVIVFSLSFTTIAKDASQANVLGDLDANSKIKNHSRRRKALP